ncbi:MAG: hypothetical protein ABJ387_03620 [Balneola sp.]
MNFEISYTADWASKPVWKADVEAKDKTEARAEFKKFYPRAAIKSIKQKS